MESKGIYKSYKLLKVDVKNMDSGLSCLDLNHDTAFITLRPQLPKLSLDLSHL